MRRSAQVAAPFLASTALALLAGCREPEMQRCVDENNKVVDDKLCANQPPNASQDAEQQRRLQEQQAQQQQREHNGLGILPFLPLYHYYYGGYGGRGLGTVVTGGATAPISGRTYVNSSGVRSGTTRGGFGKSFSSGGSHGGGEGGGHGGGGAGE